MRHKKTIALILCALMLASLTSCVKKIDTDSETADSVTTVSPDTTAVTTTAPDSDAETETDSTEATTTETAAPVPETTDAPAAEQVVYAPENPVTNGGGEGTHSSSYNIATPYAPSVLMYHLILEKPYTDLTGLFVRPVDFENQLNSLNSAGYEYMFADEYSYSSKKCVMLTFDDGYVDNYTEMFPLLKKYNAKATVFMIGYKIDQDGYLTSDMIREMAASGLVHFGSHTLSHYDLRNQSDDEIVKEFEGSKWVISQLTGQSVNAVCYPAGGVDSRVSGIAARYFSFGYTTKSAAHTEGCNPLEIPRLRVSRGTGGNALVSQLGG